MKYNYKYYNEDRRVGDQCFFDDRDVYVDFNADLKSFDFRPGQLNVDLGTSAGLDRFTLYRGEAEPAVLELEFYVGGPSYEATQTNISNLLLQGKECVVQKSDDIFEYAAVLTDRTIEKTEVEPYYLVTCTFSAIRRKPLRTLCLVENSIIYNEGNTKAGAYISFVPEKDIPTFTVMGITLKGVKKGVNYVIDGIAGKVTADGINYFGNTDLIDFPKIQHGENEITMSESVPVSLSYYPVFS